jgi:hypothetical protein
MARSKAVVLKFKSVDFDPKVVQSQAAEWGKRMDFADQMIAENAGRTAKPEADYDRTAADVVIDSMLHAGQISAQMVGGRVVA